MSDEATVQSAAAQPQDDAPATKSDSGDRVASAADAKDKAADATDKSASAKSDEAEEKKDGDDKKESDEAEGTKSSDESAPAASGETKDKSTDVEMKDTPAETEDKADDKVADAASESEKKNGDDPATPAQATAGDKSKARRKSTGVPDSKGKSLKKKQSKAKIQHIDAKPGDHFFAKLKGFPPWPVVVCEEGMLPDSMLNSRPVTAARPDGSYREDLADGGKNVGNRSFPVMYLHTNEFSWTPNTDLTDLDPDVVVEQINAKMRKDLQAAHHLAAEKQDLDYYKSVLQEFEEARLAKLEAKAAKAKTPKKNSKAMDVDGDIDMDDIDGTDKPKAKKRKADEGAETPQRSDSVKKPKIKLTNSSTPKTANGASTPKSGKESTTKSVKVKTKAKSEGKEKEAPKEPELSPEEKHMRKEKEILFLRHRLQKGLLAKEHSPVEGDMPNMSDFLGKLETFPDLEVTIIKATKINKVLKAVLKLNNIPKEDELKFKPRSQALLDKWNKILAAADGPAAPANGVNGAAKKEGANGLKEKSAEPKADEKASEKTEKEGSEEPKKDAEAKSEVASKEKTASEEPKSMPAEATAA